jgi:hypothetical protein
MKGKFSRAHQALTVAVLLVVVMLATSALVSLLVRPAAACGTEDC